MAKNKWRNGIGRRLSPTAEVLNDLSRGKADGVMWSHPCLDLAYDAPFVRSHATVLPLPVNNHAA
jgi:hypothetical protein